MTFDAAAVVHNGATAVARRSVDIGLVVPPSLIRKKKTLSIESDIS